MMKNSAKNRVVFLHFDEALRQALDPVEHDIGKYFFLDSQPYREWIKRFAENHRGDLERLYLEYKVPPSAVLEKIGLVEFSDVPAKAPKMLRSARLLRETADRLDKVASDLELLDSLGPLYGATKLRSTPGFRGELRAKAIAIREMKPATHRPHDVRFTEKALYLTDVFLKYSGQPLWDYTAKLTLVDRVAHGRDSIRKTVLAAIRRNPHGSIEKRLCAQLNLAPAHKVCPQS
jgi:hypothetical protein